MEKKVLTLKNDIQEVSLLAPFVDMLCDELQLNPAIGFNINLALEEVVTNVISYAFPPEEEHTFFVTAWADDKALTLEVRDCGKAFDPLAEAPEVDTTLGVEEREVGGLGIFLVQQVMDHVAYERRDDNNVLTLTKLLQS